VVNDAAAMLERELQVAERERVLQFLLAKLNAFPLNSAGLLPPGAGAAAAAAAAASPADRTPSRDTLVSFAMATPQPVGTRGLSAAGLSPLPAPALPKPFPVRAPEPRECSRLTRCRWTAASCGPASCTHTRP
jgi:hypothetical protein